MSRIPASTSDRTNVWRMEKTSERRNDVVRTVMHSLHQSYILVDVHASLPRTKINYGTMSEDLLLLVRTITTTQLPPQPPPPPVVVVVVVVVEAEVEEGRSLASSSTNHITSSIVLLLRHVTSSSTSYNWFVLITLAVSGVSVYFWQIRL